MNRDELLLQYPILDHVRTQTEEIRRTGEEWTTSLCPINNHKKKHFCVSINPGKQVWRCADCNLGGTIIEWEMHKTGKTAQEVMSELESRFVRPSKVSSLKESPVQQTKRSVSATYDYTDENGRLLYQVLRYDPKAFSQRQPDGKGGWINNLDGITRVLYRLPKVVKAKEVVICEGEKDADALESLGLTTTTSSGGASGWLSAYSEFLKGKDIVIIPDGDIVGQQYADSIQESMYGKANAIKRVSVSPHKDVTEFLEAKGEEELRRLIESTPHSLHPMPIYTIEEMETQYREFVRQSETRAFRFHTFPTIAKAVGKLTPGEVMLLLANTGTGKTAMLQTLARAAAPLKTLFFEMELPTETMFERSVMMEMGCFSSDVEAEYKNNDDSYADNYKNLHHIMVCPESGLTTEKLEQYIERSELKFGEKPALVVVDYIQLIKKPGTKSRYESVSEAAEQIKVIAKRTKTIIIMASQVSRPMDKNADFEPGLHSAKDSGSLENSATLVMACWRPNVDNIYLKIVKNTKGQSGTTIKCDFDGSRMRITEQALQ